VDAQSEDCSVLLERNLDVVDLNAAVNRGLKILKA